MKIDIIYFFFAEISPEVKSSCGSDGIFTETEDEGFFGGPNKSTTNIGWLVGVPSNGQFGIGYREFRRGIQNYKDFCFKKNQRNFKNFFDLNDDNKLTLLILLPIGQSRKIMRVLD